MTDQPKAPEPECSENSPLVEPAPSPSPAETQEPQPCGVPGLTYRDSFYCDHEPRCHPTPSTPSEPSAEAREWADRVTGLLIDRTVRAFTESKPSDLRPPSREILASAVEPLLRRIKELSEFRTSWQKSSMDAQHARVENYRLRAALLRITSPDQDALRAALATNDELRIIEAVTSALNWCRDEAARALNHELPKRESGR